MSDHENEHTFDREYWEEHWAGSNVEKRALPANPYLLDETAHLKPATALDAGCGTGAESIWLAEQGWQVTGADISRTALAAAQSRARDSRIADQVEWVEADLTKWQPERQWDLVVTSYAHPSIPQLELYRRLGEWVIPGGTLLVVAHLQSDEAIEHGHSAGVNEDQAQSHDASETDDFPAESTVTVSAVVALFGGPEWEVETAREHSREVDGADGAKRLDDVIVRVRRSSAPTDA